MSLSSSVAPDTRYSQLRPDIAQAIQAEQNRLWMEHAKEAGLSSMSIEPVREEKRSRLFSLLQAATVSGSLAMGGIEAGSTGNFTKLIRALCTLPLSLGIGIVGKRASTKLQDLPDGECSLENFLKDSTLRDGLMKLLDELCKPGLKQDEDPLLLAANGTTVYGAHNNVQTVEINTFGAEPVRTAVIYRDDDNSIIDWRWYTTPRQIPRPLGDGRYIAVWEDCGRPRTVICNGVRFVKSREDRELMERAILPLVHRRKLSP